LFTPRIIARNARFYMRAKGIKPPDYTFPETCILLGAMG
jgi:hypothetical protein